jgi:hypothetical protein
MYMRERMEINKSNSSRRMRARRAVKGWAQRPLTNLCTRGRWNIHASRSVQQEDASCVCVCVEIGRCTCGANFAVGSPSNRNSRILNAYVAPRSLQPSMANAACANQFGSTYKWGGSTKKMLRVTVVLVSFQSQNRRWVPSEMRSYQF